MINLNLSYKLYNGLTTKLYLENDDGSIVGAYFDGKWVPSTWDKNGKNLLCSQDYDLVIQDLKSLRTTHIIKFLDCYFTITEKQRIFNNYIALSKNGHVVLYESEPVLDKCREEFYYEGDFNIIAVDMKYSGNWQCSVQKLSNCFVGGL
jgi:hypothetical protein